MWSLQSRWFDLAVVMTIFAIGNVLFGRFEQHKPRARRVLKVIIVTGVVLLLAETLGRAWAYGFMALPLIAAAYVHLVWLPQHGISGWTAEPYDKYLELLRTRSRGV
jgi:hypothetical protein